MTGPAALLHRPATVRAYEKGELYRTRETVDEEAKKILFGQTDTAAPA